MRSLIYLMCLNFVAYKVVTQEATYRAAVVEYAPRLLASTPKALILENVEDYVNLMDQASNKGVQIIVFAEDGLTGWENITADTLHEFSTEVPDSSKQISPCYDQQANFSQFFIHLSCAASTHSLYTVINLIEREYDHKANKMIYYNTNVVFDKNGGVIARYRKTNLYNEPLFGVGNEVVTFKTDFGVTFGIFTCFDIIFKNPALDVLADPAVTDIVYPAAWFSELPFYGAISVQHGFAKSNGVNLLAAGMDSPTQGNGGSGIYLANGTIAESYISGVRATKMLIQDVPKIAARIPSAACQNISGSAPSNGAGGGLGGLFQKINDFQTITENTVNYTFKALNLNDKVISETICSGQSKFCCSFKITVNKNQNVQPNYVYKFLAYYGVNEILENKSLGFGKCALVACLDDSNSSCGGRHKQAPEGVTFESISVKGSYNPKTSHSQPATINFNLQPVSDYTYCTKTVNDVVEVEMATTQPQKSLLTFGILSRIFDNDGKPGGAINSGNLPSTETFVIFMISISVFLLQD